MLRRSLFKSLSLLALPFLPKVANAAHNRGDNWHRSLTSSQHLRFLDEKVEYVYLCPEDFRVILPQVQKAVRELRNEYFWHCDTAFQFWGALFLASDSVEPGKVRLFSKEAIL